MWTWQMFRQHFFPEVFPPHPSPAGRMTERLPLNKSCFCVARYVAGGLPFIVPLLNCLSNLKGNKGAQWKCVAPSFHPWAVSASMFLGLIPAWKRILFQSISTSSQFLRPFLSQPPPFVFQLDQLPCSSLSTPGPFTPPALIQVFFLLRLFCQSQARFLGSLSSVTQPEGLVLSLVLPWYFALTSLALLGFPGGSGSKEAVCSVGNPGLIPGLGRSPGEGNDSALQYFCLENPTDRGAWWAIVHGVTRVGYSWVINTRVLLNLGHNRTSSRWGIVDF